MQSRTLAQVDQRASQRQGNSAPLKVENVSAMPDSRSQQTMQRRLQEVANSSLSAAQMKTIQAKLLSEHASTDLAAQVKSETTQFAEDEELLQGKFATVQRAEEEELLQGKFTTVQRAEEEELLQGKFATVQRAEEEELLQGKFTTVQCAEEDELLQGKFETAQLAEDEELLQGKFSTAQLQEQGERKPNNTGLPDQLKAGVESLSGMSMDHVKVHYNSAQPAQLNAHAFAQGSDIHVAPGQEQHVPHEAWHVVQQAQGRVRPTMQMKAGVPVNDDVALESEADTMGAKAAAVGQRMEKTTVV